MQHGRLAYGTFKSSAHNFHTLSYKKNLQRTYNMKGGRMREKET